MTQLVDRLGKRLGHAQVMRLAARASYIPERAVARVAGGSTGGGSRLARCAAAAAAVRRPEPIDVMAPVPDDPPMLFRWRGIPHTSPMPRARSGSPRNGGANRTALTARLLPRRGLAAAGASGSTAPAFISDARGRAGSCTGCSDDGPAYAELQVTTNFTFLRGASHPQELVLQRGGARPSPRSRSPTATRWPASCAPMRAAKEAGMRLVSSAPARPRPTRRACCACPDRPRRLWPAVAAAHLGQRRAPKGECRSDRDDVSTPWRGPDRASPAAGAAATTLSVRALARVSAPPSAALPISRRSHLYRGDDAAAAGASGRARARAAARRWSPPTTCTTTRRRAGRCRTCSPASASTARIDEAGFRLAANAERHLKAPAEMARLFRGYPDAIARTAGDRRAPAASPSTSCATNIPTRPPHDGPHAAGGARRTCAWEGARWRYPDGVPGQGPATSSSTSWR